MEETYLDRINAFFKDYEELRNNKDIIASIDTDFFFDIMDDLRIYVETYNYTEEDIKNLLKRNCETMDKYNELLVSQCKYIEKEGKALNDK